MSPVTAALAPVPPAVASLLSMVASPMVAAVLIVGDGVALSLALETSASSQGVMHGVFDGDSDKARLQPQCNRQPWCPHRTR